MRDYKRLLETSVIVCSFFFSVYAHTHTHKRLHPNANMHKHWLGIVCYARMQQTFTIIPFFCGFLFNFPTTPIQEISFSFSSFSTFNYFFVHNAYKWKSNENGPLNVCFVISMELTECYSGRGEGNRSAIVSAQLIPILFDWYISILWDLRYSSNFDRVIASRLNAPISFHPVSKIVDCHFSSQ